MANAEVDNVSVSKLFDRKFESGVKSTARRAAERAIKAAFVVEVPKDKQARFWSVDLNVIVTLDAKTQELAAGCGVIVHIKQGSKKLMHASKPPNSAKQKEVASQIHVVAWCERRQHSVVGTVRDAHPLRHLRGRHGARDAERRRPPAPS